MFRTIGDPVSLWESGLPAEVLRLPEELARMDALPDDTSEPSSVNRTNSAIAPPRPAPGKSANRYAYPHALPPRRSSLATNGLQWARNVALLSAALAIRCSTQRGRWSLPWS